MIYIRKRKTPNIIVEKATAIKKDPASGEDFVVRGILDGYLVLEDRILLR